MKFLPIVFLLFLSLTVSAQFDAEEGCSLTTIQIASSSEVGLALRHAGFFIFLPSEGQETLWDISTTKSDEIIVSSTEPHFILDLALNNITIEDSIVVDLTIKNTNNDLCKMKDTLVWTVVSVVNVDPPVEIYGWQNIDTIGNPGDYTSGISTNTTSVLESIVNVYPNPTSGDVYIDLGQQSIAPSYISVYDGMGRLTQVMNSPDFGDSVIDLHLEEAGFYIVQIHFESEVITKKIIVK